MSRDEPLHRRSALELAASIASRECSSEEVVVSCLERIAEVNPRLNAVVALADDAVEQAVAADRALASGATTGPLHGVPVTVKEMIAADGLPWTAGTLGRKDVVARTDASAVARLKAAGAIVIGKTNQPEIGFAVETDNAIYGRTQNPYDLDRTPGGSSGGEASILAACGSPLGLGSDSGGSIRLPAHFCGVAGLCPTSGRVPRTGTFPPHVGLGQERAQLGPMARTVADLQAALAILSGPDWEDPLAHPMPLGDPRAVALDALRVAFHSDNGILRPDRATEETLRQVASGLEDRVAAIEERRPPVEETVELTFGLSSPGLIDLDNALASMGTKEASPLVQASLHAAHAHVTPMRVEDVNPFVKRLNGFRSRMLEFMRDTDVILCPVAALPAPRHGELRSAETVLAISYTQTYNLTGWPSLAVRCGFAEMDGARLPIGVQVIAAPAREDLVLRVGLELEELFGGYEPPPLDERNDAGHSAPRNVDEA